MKNVIKRMPNSFQAPPEQNRSWTTQPPSTWRPGRRTDYTYTQGKLTLHHSEQLQ